MAPGVSRPGHHRGGEDSTVLDGGVIQLIIHSCQVVQVLHHTCQVILIFYPTCKVILVLICTSYDRDTLPYISGEHFALQYISDDLDSRCLSTDDGIQVVYRTYQDMQVLNYAGVSLGTNDRSLASILMPFFISY